MEQSMRRFMKVGLILHVAYRGIGDGDGPILECLGKVVQDDYFEAVEVTSINDPAAWISPFCQGATGRRQRNSPLSSC